MEGEVQEAVQEVILEGTDFCSRSAGDSLEECHDMSDKEEGCFHNSGVAGGMAIVGFAGLGSSNFDQDKRTWWSAMQNLRVDTECSSATIYPCRRKFPSHNA